MARQNCCKVFGPQEVTVLHCVNLAVRRAMLCGCDSSLAYASGCDIQGA